MKYYIAKGAQPIGPFSISELSLQGVTPETMLWCEGMDGWKQAKYINEVNSALFGYGAVPPPPRNSYNERASIPNRPECPKTYLVHAILCTLFCCMPFGIVAIVYAAQVESNWSKGLYDLAQQKSKTAKTFVNVSFWIGVAGALLYLIYYIFLAAIVAFSITDSYYY